MSSLYAYSDHGHLLDLQQNIQNTALHIATDCTVDIHFRLLQYIHTHYRSHYTHTHYRSHYIPEHQEELKANTSNFTLSDESRPD